jgi:cobalt-zinc-cadmium resistance protein CzcA
VRGDVAVKVFGPDAPTLDRLAGRIEQVLREVPGSQDVYAVKNEGVQYLTIGIDRLAAGRLGFTGDELQNALRILVEGKTVGVIVEPGRRTPLMLRGGEEVHSGDALTRVRLVAANGQAVPLAAVAQARRVDGPVKIEHENATRMAVVQTNVRNRDLVGFVKEAKNKVAARVPLPAGYRLEWGGQFENQQRAATRLAIVVPVTLFLIFLLLFATFRSLRQSLLVLTNIPFALVGGVLALWLSGEYLSVPASVGFIALLGIAVLNGVVMVSHFNQLLAQGMEVSRAVVEGAKRRLRPVLMTASIAALGLVPLLFAHGPGSEIQRPLAIVVIGGWSPPPCSPCCCCRCSFPVSAWPLPGSDWHDDLSDAGDPHRPRRGSGGPSSGTPGMGAGFYHLHGVGSWSGRGVPQ